MNLKSLIMFIINIIFLPFYSYSSENISLKDTTKINKKYDLLLFPYCYYSLDTKFGAGGRIGLYNKNNSSSTYFNIFVSQLLQYEILFANEIYINKWKHIEKMKLSQFPDECFDIGNNSNNTSFPYSDFYFWSLISTQKLLKHNVFFGFEFEARIEKVGNSFPDDLVGNSNWYCIGIGLRLDYDTRDNVFYASKGSYINFTFKYFAPFDKVITYKRVVVDYRKFIYLFKNNILGIQTWMDLSSGKTPFQLLPSVGDALRGYAVSRYKDNDCGIFQIEDRYTFWKRLGFVAFIGAGDVFNFNDFEYKFIKIAGGCGIRFRLNDEKVNLRLDYSINRQKESAVYFSIGEQF